MAERKLPKGIRKNGNRYQGRLTYRGEQYCVSGDTITETKKKLNDLRYRLEHGLFVQKDKITYSEWFAIWMDEYKANKVKAGTLVTYNVIYNEHIKPVFGAKQVFEIRGDHVQRLLNNMVKQGLSTSAIDLVTVILNSSLKQAVKNGLIERNPVEQTEKPRGVDSKSHIALTKEQQALFMEFAKESYLYNFYTVMLRTGMRCGEMQGLKYSDIDKAKQVVHIQRTLKSITGKGYVEDNPKTKTSKRDIPLTADTIKILEDQRKFWKFKVEPINRYLFCNEYGEPLSRSRIQHELNNIVKRITEAGYDFPRITSHVLRHTFATRAIEAGMQPQTLKTILGHSSLSMTMDLYSHVLPDTKAAEMEKIASAF
ncbi:MAG: site-specific integrase [Lachnospiraceae bacterium]|nr:site-specific integrase [Lachnospiraceae bacterium]